MRLLFLLLSGILVNAQIQAQSKFSLKAPDSLAFLLTVGNTRVNNVPVVDLTMSNLPSGPSIFKATFAQYPELIIEQTIELKAGGAHYFEVARVKGKYKLALISESVTTPDLSVTTSSAPVLQLDSFGVDSTTVSVAVEKKGKCEGLVTEADFELLKSELQEMVFEVRRFEKLKSYIESHCLRAAQLRFLMAQLNTEDLKIRLLESGVNHVFDPEKLSAVEEDIFLEKNKRRVREILGSSNQK